MIEKIFFFDYQSLSDQVYENYYFSRLIDEGYKVGYIDLSKIYYPTLYREVFYKKVKIYSVESLLELENILMQNDNKSTFYVSRLTFTIKTFQLFRLFKKYNCNLAVFTRGSFPSPPIVKKYITFLKDFNQYLFYAKYLFFRRLKKMNIVAKYNYIFNCRNSLSMIGLGWREDIKKAKIIPINSVDYEKFIQIKENTLEYKQDSYVVFLDQYLPFHPDFNILTHIKPINAEDYYNNLNHFFLSIEKKYNTKIVIAAHPKAKLYKEKNYFNGRDVIFNRTSELVKFSRFVLVHDSTAMGIAILAKKSLIFLNSNLHQKYMPSVHERISFFSNYLNSTELYFDNYEENLHNVCLNLDEKKYNLYKYSFLTDKKTENLKTEDIFINTIKQIK